MNMRSEYTEEPEEKGGLSPKAIVAIVLGVLALIFVVQNTDSHKVNLLFWDARLPSWLWLLVILAAGIAIGWLLHRPKKD